MAETLADDTARGLNVEPQDAPRVVVTVLDGVGCGELPDAEAYGDAGSDTLGNTALAVGGLHLPNLQGLGLGNIVDIQGVPPVDSPTASFGRMAERSPGKDTTTGHWELMGLIREEPFPTYPDGFPAEILAAFEETCGRRVIGNKAASGTLILEELGREHLDTGSPIVYTSADSVFQIAAHEEVIGRPELYSMCECARELLLGEHAVARVIARPFVGQPGSFERTDGRRDYSLTPPSATVLDLAVIAGHGVLGIGKISEIFAARGITRSVHTDSDADGMHATIAAVRDATESVIFTNLVDFDMKFGHRNDPDGFAAALTEFDSALPELLAALRPSDTLLITADHGCDPTTPSTDHSREYVPLLRVSPSQPPTDLGTRDTFADVGATLSRVFGLPVLCGTPLL